MLLASALALAGGTLVVLVVRDGPFVAPTAPFDPLAIRKVLASRGARLATLGYLGHMWELYAMWTWVAVFAAASFAASGVAAAAGAGSIAAFIAIGSGAVGCGLAGFVADRVGRARVAMWAMLCSAACAVLTLAAYGRAPWMLYVLIMLWGFSVVADSAQFSALVSEHAPRDHVGTALTLQTCLGFLLTMVTIELLPRVAERIGWQFASLLLVPGPLLGALAMARLVPSSRHHPVQR
jgi:MFS family permease